MMTGLLLFKDLDDSTGRQICAVSLFTSGGGGGVTIFNIYQYLVKNIKAYSSQNSDIFSRHPVPIPAGKESINRDQCGHDVEGDPLSFKVVLFMESEFCNRDIFYKKKVQMCKCANVQMCIV